MFTQRRKLEFLRAEFVWFWAALAFQAGFVNAGGFLATGRFVAHMTGFGTQVGLSLSDLDYLLAFEMISAPASFLLGAMVSGVLIDRPMMRGQRPRNYAVMVILFTIFLTVTAAGVGGWFGTFGEPLRYGRDFLLMSLLCFACGMQNACFSSLTRGAIRTTHLTGLLTDIGTTTVKLIVAPEERRDRMIWKRMNAVRWTTFVAFSSGSTVSAVLFARIGFAAFAFAIASSAIIFTVMVVKTRARARTTKEMARFAA